MKAARPMGGSAEFMARGGATFVGDALPVLARRLRDHLKAARGIVPAAGSFLASRTVAFIPEIAVPEASKALRLALAVGATAITVCAVTPTGALAGPQAPYDAPDLMPTGSLSPHASIAEFVPEAGLRGGATKPYVPPPADPSSVARAHGRDLMSAFGPISQKMAEELHPDLLEVAALARRETGIEFEIVPGTGGHRTLEMQRQLVRRGASKTLTSRHMSGLAADFVPMRRFGQLAVPNFFDRPTYMRIDAAMRKAAQELGVPLTSGLDFKGFPDLGHFELEKHSYAAYVPGQDLRSYVHREVPAPVLASEPARRPSQDPGVEAHESRSTTATAPHEVQASLSMR